MATPLTAAARRLWVLLWFGVLTAVPLHASEDTTAELAQLVEQRNFIAAYELALEHRFEHEGELGFDFYYGMAAIEVGELSEGVFALERVIMQRPGFSRARLELARGYYLMEEDTRARHHFSIVEAQSPPPTVVATIDRYRQRMDQRADRQRTRVSGGVSLTVGYDSNVNSATDADNISVTLGELSGELALPESSQARDDGFGLLAGHVMVQRPALDQWTVFAGLDGEARLHFEESDFDTQRAGLRLGTQLNGDVFTPRVTLRAQRFYVDGEEFQDLLGVSLGLSQSFSERMLGRYGLEYARLMHDDASDRDGHLILASAGVTQAWQVPMTPLTTVSLFAGRLIADSSSDGAQANTDRWQGGVNALGQLQVATAWRLSSRLQYRLSRYSGRNALFDNERRLDHFGQASLGAEWQPLARLQVKPQLEYRRNESNIELYSYERVSAQVGVHSGF